MAVVRSELDVRYALAVIEAFFPALLGGLFQFPWMQRNGFLHESEMLVILLGAAQSIEWNLGRRVLDLSYFALPLYGRQLARAHAIPMLLCALAPPLGYMSGSALAGVRPDVRFLLFATLAVGVKNLASLSVAFRNGPSAWLFRALSVAGGLIVGGLAIGATADGMLASLLCASAFGFIALRQLGETIARYDPLP